MHKNGCDSYLMYLDNYDKESIKAKVNHLLAQETLQGKNAHLYFIDNSPTLYYLYLKDGEPQEPEKINQKLEKEENIQAVIQRLKKQYPDKKALLFFKLSTENVQDITLNTSHTHKNEQTKVRFEEVKTTTHPSNDKAEFSMNEIRFITNPDKEYKSRIYNIYNAGQTETGVGMEKYKGEALTQAINVTNEQSTSESKNPEIVGILVKFSVACSKKWQVENSKKSGSSNSKQPEEANKRPRTK
jgi:Domain of unknown function (DUF3883)